MNFEKALTLLKNGKYITRKGWNGKGMYLFLYTDGGFIDDYEIQNFILLKTVNDTVIPWIASQSDILAEDWEVK